jgi:hypothetical protein
VDDAMAGIERDNPALKSVLPKEYARPALDKARVSARDMVAAPLHLLVRAVPVISEHNGTISVFRNMRALG